MVRCCLPSRRSLWVSCRQRAKMLRDELPGDWPTPTRPTGEQPVLAVANRAGPQEELQHRHRIGAAVPVCLGHLALPAVATALARVPSRVTCGLSPVIFS